MNPRILQSEIHANLQPTTGDITGWRAEITGLYLTGGYRTVTDSPISGTGSFGNQDFASHLMKEYNRKCYYAGTGQFTGEMLTPYDGGFGYTGTGAF
jgi:hypothetical protein